LLRKIEISHITDNRGGFDGLNDTQKGEVFLRTGEIHYKKGEYEKALSFFNRGSVTSDPRIKIKLYKATGLVFRKLGSLDQSNELLDRAYKMAKKEKNFEELADILFQKGNFSLHTGKGEEAISITIF